jgi:hypothetical protein
MAMALAETCGTTRFYMTWDKVFQLSFGETPWFSSRQSASREAASALIFFQHILCIKSPLSSP